MRGKLINKRTSSRTFAWNLLAHIDNVRYLTPVCKQYKNLTNKDQGTHYLFQNVFEQFMRKRSIFRNRLGKAEERRDREKFNCEGWTTNYELTRMCLYFYPIYVTGWRVISIYLHFLRDP